MFLSCYHGINANRPSLIADIFGFLLGLFAAFPFLLLSRFLQPIHISSRHIFKSLDLQFEMSVHGWITFGNKLILSYYSIRQ